LGLAALCLCRSLTAKKPRKKAERKRRKTVKRCALQVARNESAKPSVLKLVDIWLLAVASWTE
jgi:hypothetical protein